MNKVMKLFLLSAGLVYGCGTESGKPTVKEKKSYLTLEAQNVNKDEVTRATAVLEAKAPCVIEVACNEAELTAIGVDEQRKFYDFCDSTVTTYIWQNKGGSSTSATAGPAFSQRSLLDVHGTEIAEKDAAYAIYKNGFQPQ